MKYIKQYENLTDKFIVGDIIVNKNGFFIEYPKWIEPGQKFEIIKDFDHGFTIKNIETLESISQGKRWILSNFITKADWDIEYDSNKYNL